MKINLGHAHKTRFCYLLGMFLKFSNQHPRHFYSEFLDDVVGVKINLGHAHKTRFCYLLGMFLKFSNQHPRHFYRGVLLALQGGFRDNTISWTALLVKCISVMLYDPIYNVHVVDLLSRKSEFLDDVVGVKINLGHAHKTRFCYLLGMFLKFSNQHPHHFYRGVLPALQGGFRDNTISWTALLVNISVMLYDPIYNVHVVTLKGLCHENFADIWSKLSVLKLVVGNLTHKKNIIFEHLKEDMMLIWGYKSN